MIVARAATMSMGYDPNTGLLTSRTMPGITAAKSGSGVAIPPQIEIFNYDPVNRKRILTETRKDGQNGTINIARAVPVFV